MPENPLEGVDAPRPMPAALRARLEQGLLAAAPLPHPARERISKRLADPTPALLDGVDGPRPLPGRARRRLEGVLVKPMPTRRPRMVSSRPWLVAAAAATLILASVSAITNRPDPGVTQTAGDDVNLDSAESSEGVIAGAGVGDPGFVQSAGQQSGTGAVGRADSAGGVGGGGSGRNTGPSRQPPPYALDDSEFTSAAVTTPDAGPAEPPTTTTTPAPPPPFRISVAAGDATGVAGFNAYIELLNRHGGAGGRQFVLVKDGEPADVSVNLSGSPLAGALTVESFLSPDRLLRGNTFSFIGAIDRQAHLIADAVYPANAGGTAAIYREAAGPLHDDVPAALDAVLRQRGLTTVLVDVRANEAVVPVPADSVFLSVSAANARRVVEAYPTNSRPPRGFNGIGTLAESNAVPSLPPGTRFISPYAFPDSNEARRVQELTKLPPGARLYHGWVVAKTLAVAVWRYDPRSTAEVTVALDHMSGYANGFAPAYTYRPGTRSVRPEGVLFEVQKEGAVQKGDFLTDPRP